MVELFKCLFLDKSSMFFRDKKTKFEEKKKKELDRLLSLIKSSSVNEKKDYERIYTCLSHYEYSTMKDSKGALTRLIIDSIDLEHSDVERFIQFDDWI